MKFLSFGKCLGIFILVASIPSCAVLHHVQVGDVDNTKSFKKRPFDIKLSETGINIDEAKTIAKSFGGKSGKTASDAASVYQLFTMGPTTGNMIYDEKFGDNLILAIHEQCPSGRVSGLVSIREMNKYPVVSGEIVHVTGYCHEKK